MPNDGGLRQLFRTHLPQVFWTSVETGATGRGTPDSFAAYKGQAIWIEFKFTKAFSVKIRPEQIAWHERLSRNGCRSFVAIRRTNETRSGRIDQLYIFDGSLIDFCHNLYQPKAPFKCYQGGPAKWDWEAILRYLFD